MSAPAHPAPATLIRVPAGTTAGAAVRDAGLPGRGEPGAVVVGNVNANGSVNGAITQIGGGAAAFANGRGGRDLAPGGGSILGGGQNARVGGVSGEIQANRMTTYATATTRTEYLSARNQPS